MPSAREAVYSFPLHGDVAVVDDERRSHPQHRNECRVVGPAFAQAVVQLVHGWPQAVLIMVSAAVRADSSDTEGSQIPGPSRQAGRRPAARTNQGPAHRLDGGARVPAVSHLGGDRGMRSHSSEKRASAAPCSAPIPLSVTA